jgi:iron complex outermembrane receptor protein
MIKPFLLFTSISLHIVFGFSVNVENTIGKAKLIGKTIDKQTGEPLTGVAIYIPELQTGAVSGYDGGYKITNLPRAKILYQVSYIGYSSIIGTIDLSVDSIRDFALEIGAKEMTEVVVTGASRVSEIKTSPLPIATIDRRGIDQNLNTNIIDAITKMPGVNAVTTGPNISKPFIRGLGYNRVLTLMDGIRQEGQQWGDEHGIEVDENSISKVEVIKGPASLIYGSDAMAGVVNLIPAPPLPYGTIKANIISEYQTNNGLIDASASIKGNQGGLSWGTTLSHKQASNYQNKVDGRVYGTAYSETDGSGFVGLNRHWGYSHLNFSVFTDLQEIPDGSRDSLTRLFTKQITEADTFRPIVSSEALNSYKISPLHQLVQHYNIYSSNNIILGQGKLALKIGFQENVRREFSHPQFADVPGLYLLLKTFSYDIKYYLPEIHGLETTLGVNGMAQINQNKGTEFIIPDYKQFDLGPFVYLKKSFDQLEISAGLRYDLRYFLNHEMFVAENPKTGLDMQVSGLDTLGAKQTFSRFSHVFSGLSGSLGASYAISRKLTLKANIARGFRSPNIAEISANGVHPGTNIYQIGNTGFVPEFNIQEDLGIIYSAYHMEASLEIFNNDISNYIFNQKVLNHLGGDSIIIPGNQTFKFQESHARLTGGEASLDIHPHPYDWIHFENSISLVFGSNLGSTNVHTNDSSKYLPFIPPVHTRTELRADIKKISSFISRAYVKFEIEHSFKQNRAYLADNTETPTAGYTLLNAGFGGDILNKKNKPVLSLFVQVNNLADVAYQSHMSRLKYFEPYPNNYTGKSGIYNMGRNISFKLIIPISIKE